jgi:hypothetical protein
MTRKSAKNVSPGKGHEFSRPPSGGLTCTERQVDDVLSAGESTEEERRPLPTENHPAKAPIKWKAQARARSLASTSAYHKAEHPKSQGKGSQ